MTGKRYSIGFARPALLNETQVVAQVFCQVRSWDQVRKQVKESNLLQTRTQRSSAILCGEIIKRLSLLNAEQIELIAEGEAQELRHLVWIALCKQYPFIADFTLEVLVDAHTLHRLEVTYDDYSYFFNAKADWHPELEAVSDKTRSNSRQTLFQMMRQCELINENNRLIPQMLSSALQNCSPEADLVFIPGAIRL